MLNVAENRIEGLVGGVAVATIHPRPQIHPMLGVRPARVRLPPPLSPKLHRRRCAAAVPTPLTKWPIAPSTVGEIKHRYRFFDSDWYKDAKTVGQVTVLKTVEGARGRRMK